MRHVAQYTAVALLGAHSNVSKLILSYAAALVAIKAHALADPANAVTCSGSLSRVSLSLILCDDVVAGIFCESSRRSCRLVACILLPYANGTGQANCTVFWASVVQKEGNN